MKKTSKSDAPKSTRSLPTTKRDFPATVGLVLEIRDELKAEIRASVANTDSRFSTMQAQLNGMEASMHRMEARNEQQHSDNRIMYEALQLVIHRSDEFKNRVDLIERDFRSLVKR